MGRPKGAKNKKETKKTTIEQMVENAPPESENEEFPGLTDPVKELVTAIMILADAITIETKTRIETNKILYTNLEILKNQQVRHINLVPKGKVKVMPSDPEPEESLALTLDDIKAKLIEILNTFGKKEAKVFLYSFNKAESISDLSENDYLSFVNKADAKIEGNDYDN